MLDVKSQSAETTCRHSAQEHNIQTFKKAVLNLYDIRSTPLIIYQIL